ncbi:MAG: ATPase domain-containing protein [Gemmatimonadota bacterium]
MNVSTGIGPLDDRIGGVRKEGLYLLTGGADTAKLACQLQFVDQGLREGERVAVLSAATPEDLSEQADYLGFSLRSHWQDGSCIFLGFKGDYARRVVHAPDPIEAFDELSRMIDPPVDRLVVDPGSFLWSTRAGTSMAQAFALWAEASGATVMASVAAGLDERPDPATEWVLQRATGVFHFARMSTGIHEISIQRLTPPVDAAGPISLELVAGHGLSAPSGQIDRRRTDRVLGHPDRALLLRLGSDIPADLETWLTTDRDAVDAVDGMDLIQRLQADEFGLVFVYVDRNRTDDAIEVIRTARTITAGAILLLSDEELRSGDRARALDAGADDVLSHGIHLKELDARIRRALDSARPARGADRDRTHVPEAVNGLVPQEDFARLLADRLASGEMAHFSLIAMNSADTDALADALLSMVRAESGDVVGPLGGGLAVLLQDVRAQQADAFLGRVRSELEQRGVSGKLEAEVLANPEETERIRALIEA